MRRVILAFLLMGLLVTAGCASKPGNIPQTSGDTTQNTESETTTGESTEQTSVQVTETTRVAGPDDMVGVWQRIYTEVEGDRVETNPGVCTVQISGDEASGFQITYTDQEYPDTNYTDAKLMIVPGEELVFLGSCGWAAEVDNGVADETNYVIMPGDGTLLIATTWTMDGIPMVGYGCFQRS